MSKRAVIFLNGNPPSDDLAEKIDFGDAFVVCADGAYDYASKFCRPDLLVGDFDSLSSEADESVCIERVPVKKDFTDSQLAVHRAVENGCDTIDIYGAFGGRRDHELVNYSLLALADRLGVAAVLRGEEGDVAFVTPSRPFSARLEKGATVSLVPYSDNVHILYTKGLLFEAADVSVDKTEIFTTSNVVSGDAVEYRLTCGTALLLYENRRIRT